MTQIATIPFKGVELEIEYYYQPEEKEVTYYSDGGGYPGCPAQCEIRNIMLGDYDVTELLRNSFTEIERLILAGEK